MFRDALPARTYFAQQSKDASMVLVLTFRIMRLMP
jgi:hypothetical protein